MTFTQLLSSEVLQFKFSVALRPQRLLGLLVTASSTFSQLLSSEIEQVQCCFTPTETVGTVRDGEPRTSTSTFSQLLSYEIEQVQCCFTSTETVGTVSDGLLDLLTAPEL